MIFRSECSSRQIVASLILVVLCFTVAPVLAEDDEGPELITTTATMLKGDAPSATEGGLSAKIIDGAYEYRVGPLDELLIEVFGVPELTDASVITSAGEISLPLLGTVFVNGMTTKEIEAEIVGILKKDYMHDPHVTVDITNYQSQLVTVDGAIGSPGVYPLKGKTTFLQIIVTAGGMSKVANSEEVIVYRKLEGKGTIGYVVDYEKVRDSIIPDPVMRAGDVVVVQQSGGKALFYGTTELLKSVTAFSIFY